MLRPSSLSRPTILVLPITALLLLAFAGARTSAAPAALAAGESFPKGQCTYWAYLKRPYVVDHTSLLHPTLDWNGGWWAKSAKQGGFRVGTTAAVGALAVWPPNADGAGAAGHVAYVERVFAGGSFSVSEMNFNNSPNVHHRVVARSSALRFIYRQPHELAPVGQGRLVSIGGSYSSTGIPSLTISLTGRARLLLRATGPGGFVKSWSRVLDSTTTTTLADFLGAAQPRAGSYALRVVVSGAGGGSSTLTLPVS